MGFKIGNRKKRQRAESADSELSAFKDDLTYLDEERDSDEYYEEDEYYEDEAGYDTESIDTEEIEAETYYDTEPIDSEEIEEELESETYYDTESIDTEEIEEEIGYDTASIDYEESEEYYDEDDSYTEYEDDRDYFDADEDYDSEYNTASFDTASLEVLSHVDYDTASIDYRSVRRTVEEQEYYDEDGLEYDRDYKSDYDYEDSYDDSYSESYEDSYEDSYDEPEPRKKSDKLEEDEYVDLDKSYDHDDDKPHKKGNIVRIVIIAAAVLLLAAVGVFALKDKIFNRSTVADVEYITTPSGVTLPYSEQMVGSGSQITTIERIGQNGLISALDARKTSVADASPEPTPSESHDYGESDIITRTSVSIELITVKSDLKIRFINNETGKLIPNVAFKVTVTDPSGKSLTWSDDDKDGIIYKSSISEGKYTVHVEKIEGDTYQGYTWPSDKSVTVKSTIEYAVVDVQGEVKEAAQVNENAEDTASRGNTDQQDMTDTTQNVASSESTDYTEIAKDTITDPGVTDVSGNGNADANAQLKDKSGNEVYVFENNAYRKATNADYAKFDKFYIVSGTKYTGWQTIGGATYYYDVDGKPVTGTQVIGGVTYQFAADGKLTSASGILGIDVSKWNGAIDWNAVKAAGVEFVIIRVGYRGSSAGALIDDAMFTTNIQGAKAAGLKVGVYFVTQAINDVEAVYEASMVLDRIKGYSLDMPVFLDVEASGGRGDMIDKATRTAVITAFCETIRNAGYTAGIYANKTWLGTKMDASAFGNYVIWVAHYSSVCGYTGRYTVWQYTDKGTLPGINGSVDLNLWYS